MPSHSAQRLLFPLLSPLGLLYGAAMSVRRHRLEREGAGIAPSVPVVSVGNIGWGGTGKTPVVDWLLGWAAQEGLRAVVLTRGYKAAPPGLPYLVDAQSGPGEAGDEPLMLARQHPLARVVVDPVRSRAAQWAQEALSPNFFILDDGFQHLAVRRNLDIVLLAPEDLREDWNRVIPAGSWREGAGALSRAHAFVIKADPAQFTTLLPDIRRRLAVFDVPVFGFHLRPTGIVRACCGEDSVSPCLFAPDGYVLFSGVGNPAQVEATATAFLGRPPVRHHIFADHHRYTADDVDAMVRMARTAGPSGKSQQGLPLLCTPKDAVKMAALPPEVTGGVWTFALKTEFGSAWNCTASFPGWWDEAWRGMTPAEG